MDEQKHFMYVSSGTGVPAPPPPDDLPGPLRELIWTSDQTDNPASRQTEAYFHMASAGSERAGLKPLAARVSTEVCSVAFSRSFGIPGLSAAPVAKADEFMLMVALHHGVAFCEMRPGFVTPEARAWLEWFGFSLQNGPMVFDAGSGVEPDNEAPERVAAAIERLLTKDSGGAEKVVEAGGSRRPVTVPTDILVPYSEAWKTTVAGLTNASKGKYMGVTEGVVVRNPAKLDLDVKFEGDADLGEITFEQCSRQLQSFVSVLSLKQLLGSSLAWAENTGASRYDQSCQLSFNQLMKFSGLSSNPHAELRDAHLQAFLPLVRAWVQVPTYGPGPRGKTGTRGRVSVDYERILAADKMRLVPCMFKDDPDFSTFDIWNIRYYPGEWLFRGLFGKESASARLVPFKLLQYDARRQPWHIKIGFYLTPLLARPLKSNLERDAKDVLRGAGLGQKTTDLARTIRQLNRAVGDLEHDGILEGSRIEDIGDGYSPRERLAEWRLVVDC